MRSVLSTIVVCSLLRIFQFEKRKSELHVLQHARIVGMTTTGAAINQQLLNLLKAPVVFIEEAAEVLESNLLATLTPHVKHLILIGDHVQLKPWVSILCIVYNIG